MNGTELDKTQRKPAGIGNEQGRRLVAARRITLAMVFVAVMISLAFDSGLGTPSTFGVGQFFLLCPLGGIEAMIASRSFIPVAAISMAVMLVITLLFGRTWCAWGCPAPVIRKFFKRGQPHENQQLPERKHPVACEPARGIAASLRYIGRDSRTWALVAVIIAAFIAGFPIFCLVCPIGLTFGTVGSLWHLIVDKQMTLSVVVFPAALAVELVLYRRWCMNLCPIAGLTGIVGQVARLFRPRINASTCLRYNEGINCQTCVQACPEDIDMHTVDAARQLGECTRCGECASKCPTASIELKLTPSDPVTGRHPRR